VTWSYGDVVGEGLDLKQRKNSVKVTFAETKQRLREGEKHLNPFCDLVNPNRYLSRLEQKLWMKYKPKNSKR